MKFQFQVNIAENDYIEFNKFHQLRSPYGIKNILTFRILVAVICFGFVIANLSYGSFDFEAWLTTIPIFVIFIVFNVFIRKMLGFSIKQNIKHLKKHGKMAYAPSAILEFGENSLVETTENTKAEIKYSTIERISVIGDKYIYIHFNNVSAVIMPETCFENEAQREKLLEFLRTLNTKYDLYNG